MMSNIAIALIVIFGAALMGKMLMDLFPGSVFGASKDKTAEDTTPAE